MRKSILIRIASPFILLIIVLFTGLGIYLTSFVKNIYIDSLIQHLEVNAKIIADQAKPLLISDSDGQNLEEIIINYSNLMSARITIIRPDGIVLSDSEINLVDLENHSNRKEIIDAIQYGFGSDIRISQSTKEESLYVALPIITDNQEILAISRVSISISTINQKLRNFQLSIIGASLLTAIIVIILAFMITKRTLEPLKQLNSAINRMEIVDFALEQNSKKKDEIELLSLYLWKITDHLNKQNEELKLERKTLNAVLNQMTDAVLIVDESGKVQLSNPAAERLFNIKREDISEKSIIEILRNHQLFDLWKTCRKERQQNEITIEINPNKLFVQAIAKPLDEIFSGGVLLVIQDLTRVRQLEKIRSDFVSNVSHELRTPIASIKALSDTLQEGALEDPSAARRFLNRMDVEIDNLTQMVQELLELSKIESGRVPLRKIKISPMVLVDQAIERMQVQAERSGLSLSSEIPDFLPEIPVDPDKIGQVFVNLLHNAIKFTPPGGIIKVRVQDNLSEITFSVEDSGIGIESISVNR
ncbi:MAG: cell wall metabolism sensor histidine kinase WalK, partial [Anaerolineaceae bacterium]|nr:cell wall metabolism sensor histidine kinase WalK [Anaerolineaceae bacterium]